MKRYAVSFISFHDNNLVMDIVSAENEIEAGKMAFGVDPDFGDEEFETLDELKQYAFDGDCMVGVIEIK